MVHHQVSHVVYSGGDYISEGCAEDEAPVDIYIQTGGEQGGFEAAVNAYDVQYQSQAAARPLTRRRTTSSGHRGNSRDRQRHRGPLRPLAARERRPSGPEPLPEDQANFPDAVPLVDGSDTMRDDVVIYQSQGYPAQLQSPSYVPNSPYGNGLDAPHANTFLYGNEPRSSQGTHDLGGAAFSSRGPAAQSQAPDPAPESGFMDFYWSRSVLSGSEALRSSGQAQQQRASAPQARSAPPATVLPAPSPSQYSQTVGGNEPSVRTDTYSSRSYQDFDPHAGQASVTYTADNNAPVHSYFPQDSQLDQKYDSNNTAMVDADIQGYEYGYNCPNPAPPVVDSYAPVFDPCTGAYVSPEEEYPASGF